MSESLLSVRGGIQSALSHLGRLPRVWQIDNSSPATQRLTNNAPARWFSANFLAVIAHFGLDPQTINVGCPNENGHVESLNGLLKRKRALNPMVSNSLSLSLAFADELN